MTPGVVVEVREPRRLPLWLVVVDRLPIGRAGDGLLLADGALSRHHCELRLGPAGLTVRDLGSSNGTTCNGEPVTDERAVVAGDVVRIGDTEVRIGAPTTFADVSHEAPPDTREVSLHATVARAPAPAPATGHHVDLRGSLALVAEAASAAVRDDEPGALRASIVGDTVTMVFSDIVDSTALTHRLGDSRWYGVLGAHNDVVRQQLARYQGTEVKSVGDGFLLTFPSARHGLLFCISVQRVLAARRADDFPVHVRMGVHTGEAVREAGDLFGSHVNYAARVSGHAGADEILSSSLARELALPMGDISFAPPRVVALKGFPGDHQVHPVEWT